jgi:hypothetical protein
MKNLLALVFLSIFIACSNNKSVIQQYSSPYKDTLIDNSSRSRFYLDTALINVYAFDKSGSLLWRTDPWKDNNLMEYRVKRPKIRYFEFKRDKWTDSIEVIGIGYDNSQFGYLDKLTGRFTFQGQD